MKDDGFLTKVAINNGGLRQYRVRNVAELLTVSEREVWRLVAKRQLAPPAKIGRCSVWFESDISEFQARLREQRERKAK
jgi:predicted DNA-binding transcriptional regulator AlpA